MLDTLLGTDTGKALLLSVSSFPTSLQTRDILHCIGQRVLQYILPRRRQSVDIRMKLEIVEAGSNNFPVRPNLDTQSARPSPFAFRLNNNTPQAKQASYPSTLQIFDLFPIKHAE